MRPTYEELAAALERLEWCLRSLDFTACPECRWSDVHGPRCELGKLRARMTIASRVMQAHHSTLQELADYGSEPTAHILDCARGALLSTLEDRADLETAREALREFKASGDKAIIIQNEQDETGVWVATIAALPGVITQGRTRDEASDRIYEALDAWLVDDR